MTAATTITNPPIVTATTAGAPLVLASVPTAAPIITPDGLLLLLKTVDADLPLLQSFLAQAIANPALMNVFVTFYPGFKPFVAQLPQIQKWLLFFQNLEKAFLAALPPAA